MTGRHRVRVLLVEDNREFAHLVQLFLKKFDAVDFEVVWRDNGAAALRELAKGEHLDVILMDYFLPGQNGLETTRALRDGGATVPVVFLTVNKDFDLAVEVMKLGVEDYLVKEEISTPVLPLTLMSVLEKKRLRDELAALEIAQERLQTIQGLVVQITNEMHAPLRSMRDNVERLLHDHEADQLHTYLTIIRDNVVRIESKIAQLKTLKTDRTIPYVRDIRMLDLSEGGDS